MAVTITTKFYDSSAWQDLAKIVFTSPNMDTPNTVGTRSHILPGQQDLGLWYEDTSNMYRIKTSQTEESSTYFGYNAELNQSFDLDNPELYITVSGANQSDWIEFIRQEVDRDISASWDSWPLKFNNNAVNTGSDSFTASSGTTALNAFNDTGWTVDEVGGTDHWVEVEFSSYKKISLVRFKSPASYETKYFKIQAKFDSGSSYIDLYEGQMYYSNKYQTHYFSNYNSYKFYRILVQSKWAAASGMGIKNCEMMEVAQDESITVSKTLYIDADRRIDVNTINIVSDENSLFRLEVDNVYGTGVLPAGTKLYGWGWPGWKNEEGKYATFNGDHTSSSTTINLDNDDSKIDSGDYVWLGPSTDVSNTGQTERLLVSSAGLESIIVPSTTYAYKDGDPISASVSFSVVESDVNTHNSVVFEVTNGEAYDCRLTAWDDVTHSSNLNTLFLNDNCRVSALVFNCNTSKDTPTENDGVSFIHPPVLNRVFKGDTVYLGESLYYGDFDMKYRTDSSVYGDFLMFKPMLYGLNASTPYGVHDYVICLHYSYT